jgi:hypothetical protein
VQERAGRLPLSWFLLRESKIPITELAARQAAGTPVTTVVKHQGSKGRLHHAGIATLEDAAAMMEVEFAGLPGVGSKVLSNITAALKKHGLKFKPGPRADQLGAVVRSQREGAGLEVEELVPAILRAIDAPEKRSAEDDGKSKAFWHAEAALQDCERGAKGLAPQLLDVVAGALDTSRAGMLAEAMQVELV